jgi:hypothetical protein
MGVDHDHRLPGSSNNKDVVIKGLTRRKIPLQTTIHSGQRPAEITRERKFPDMDFICESENRFGAVPMTPRRCSPLLGDPPT